MSQTTQIIQALKKALRAKGLTYAQVAKQLDLSEASIKRLFSEQSFSLSRVEQILQLLDMSFFDLVKLTKMASDEQIRTLTLEQEEALASDPLLVTYFYLLNNGWKVEELCETYDIDPIQTTKLLTTLDKLKLIELYPNNRVRLRTARSIAWRKGGPLLKLYEKKVKVEFFQSEFAEENELMEFDTAELSDASAKVMQRKVEKLHMEFDELAEADMSLPLHKKQRYGLMVAIRPWTYSLVPVKKKINAQTELYEGQNQSEKPLLRSVPSPA
ncbi:MAG: helix-turn-helix transcriptional regulator [Gammaproteobacteria bacterium]|nr:helix-turn-helix transcriptional regulator [Gammaproteobacteria bacterium]